jgi:hypothetical protein
MVPMNQPLSDAEREQRSRERFDAGRISRPLAIRTADDVKIGGPPDRMPEIVDFKLPDRRPPAIFEDHSKGFALVPPVCRQRLWSRNPKYFYEDAGAVRRRQEDKRQFFEAYNAGLAKKINYQCLSF